MCGIVGYVGSENAVSYLLNGLKKLEYRGYDSSGIVVGKFENNEPKFYLYKKVGKLKQLISALPKELSGSWGIGHTRWATHGLVTDQNAHPFYSQNKKIAVVHNGIIENFQSLRKSLKDEGYIFSSETDSEVIPNLVETVKGAASHESDVFTQVAEARSNAGGVINVDSSILDDPESFSRYQKIQNDLGQSLQRLLMVTENYPSLQADENFLTLQSQIEGCENRISVERKRYNDSVGEYNTQIRVFPKNIIAGMNGFKAKQRFSAQEEAASAPKVQF